MIPSLIMSNRAYRYDKRGFFHVDMSESGVLIDSVLMKPARIVLSMMNPAMIKELCAIVDRIAPFLTVYFAPHLSINDCNFQGLSLGNKPVIFVSTSSPVTARSTLYHEIFHAIESDLSAFIGCVRDDTNDAFYCNDPYFDSETERAARLFENFAMTLDHGGHFRFSDDDVAIAFMNDIFTGEFAKNRHYYKKEAARHRSAPPAESLSTKPPRSLSSTLSFFSRLFSSNLLRA